MSAGRWKSSPVPDVHTGLVPVLEPGCDLGRTLRFPASVQFGEEEGKLLSKSVKTLPPMAAAVLVAVASEEIVKELVYINEHFFVMLGGIEKGVGGDWSHLGSLARSDRGHGEGFGVVKGLCGSRDQRL